MFVTDLYAKDGAVKPHVVYLQNNSEGGITI